MCTYYITLTSSSSPACPPSFLTYKYPYKYTPSVAHIVDTLYYRLYGDYRACAITSSGEARYVTFRADPTDAAPRRRVLSVLRYDFNRETCGNCDISALVKGSLPAACLQLRERKVLEVKAWTSVRYQGCFLSSEKAHVVTLYYLCHSM